jgi:hypothetical protein
VPDEFPTLEAVVIIGVIAALVGTFQLRAARSEIPKRAKDLERALRAGDLNTARALCGHAEGAGFAAIGGAVVGALGRTPLPEASELPTSAALGVGVFFYAALGLALVATAFSPILRRAVLHELEQSSTGVLAAALAYLGDGRGHEIDGCSACGATESVRLGPLALAGVERFGIERLDVCLDCGRVSGQVAAPRAIVVEPTGGVELHSALPPAENSSAAPDREHHG